MNVFKKFKKYYETVLLIFIFMICMIEMKSLSPIKKSNFDSNEYVWIETILSTEGY